MRLTILILLGPCRRCLRPRWTNPFCKAGKYHHQASYAPGCSGHIVTMTVWCQQVTGWLHPLPTGGGRPTLSSVSSCPQRLQDIGYCQDEFTSPLRPGSLSPKRPCTRSGLMHHHLLLLGISWAMLSRHSAACSGPLPHNCAGVRARPSISVCSVLVETTFSHAADCSQHRSLGCTSLVRDPHQRACNLSAGIPNIAELCWPLVHTPAGDWAIVRQRLLWGKAGLKESSPSTGGWGEALAGLHRHSRAFCVTGYNPACNTSHAVERSGWRTRCPPVLPGRGRNASGILLFVYQLALRNGALDTAL